MEESEIKQLQTIERSEEEIDLRDLFFMLLSKLKWIVLCGIIGCLAAYGFTHYFIAPKYEATSKVYIVSASSDSVINLSDLQLGTSLTADYKELLLSRPMLESICDNLKLEMDVDDLRKCIDITNPSGTRILKISVKTTQPELSRDIANEMATLSKTWLSEIMESRQPNIVERAITPMKKCAPSNTKNTLIGGFSLACLYCVVLIIGYMMDDTVHSSEEFERYFAIVPMAVVPEVDSFNTDKNTKTKKSRGGRK